MNIQLLQWGLLCFTIGLVLSLPLAAVYYGNKKKDARIKQVINNPKKLKSAHVDYFMQALSLGFVYLLEFVQKDSYPMFVAIPLIFGALANPTILLIEATPLRTSRRFAIVYMILRALSPVSLLFAWAFIAERFLPGYLMVAIVTVVLGGAIVFLPRRKVGKLNQENNTQIPN
jgi:hypothetical protein